MKCEHAFMSVIHLEPELKSLSTRRKLSEEGSVSMTDMTDRAMVSTM